MPQKKVKGPLGFWDFPIINKMLGGFSESSILVDTTEVDSEIERMIEAKKAEWRAKGYPEKLIAMAEELAKDWTARMSEAFAPPELRAAAAKYNIKKGLEVADRWITRMAEAARASGLL